MADIRVWDCICTDWRGWLIESREWGKRLWVQDDVNGVPVWTADIKRARGFRRKGEAEEYRARLLVDHAYPVFAPWRAHPTTAEHPSAVPE